MNIDILLKAKKEVSAKFKMKKGIIGFGIGKECVKIYVEHNFDTSILPSQHNNIPIEIVKSVMPTAGL